jgi:molybdenum cofactor cytidylyltransferase
MYLKKLTPQEAVGHLLCHHQSDQTGRRVLKKGRIVSSDDAETLRSLGKTSVLVAIREPEDVSENEAAQILGEALAGPGLTISRASNGRVNLMAAAKGLFKVDPVALARLNSLSGITLATRPTDFPVEPRTYVGTIKIIPYAVPASDLEQALDVCRASPVVDLIPFSLKRVTLVTVGHPAAEQKVRKGFTEPLRQRIEAMDGHLETGPYVTEDEEELAQALQAALDDGAEMLLIAGETSIVDPDDVIPRAISAIGGQVIQYGVPVEPGNLLLLAYRGRVPIVGTPGCARSQATNVVDLVLRRLMAADRLTRSDLISF